MKIVISAIAFAGALGLGTISASAQVPACQTNVRSVARAAPELAANAAASAAADVKRRVRKGLVIYFLHWVRGAPDRFPEPSPAPEARLVGGVKNIN